MFELLYIITRWDLGKPRLDEKIEEKIIQAENKTEAFRQFYALKRKHQYLNTIHYQLVKAQDVSDFEEWLKNPDLVHAVKGDNW